MDNQSKCVGVALEDFVHQSKLFEATVQEHVVAASIFLHDRICLVGDHLLLDALENLGLGFRLQPVVRVFLLLHQSVVDLAKILRAVQLRVPHVGLHFVLLSGVGQHVLLKFLLVRRQVLVSFPSEALRRLHWLCSVETHVDVALDGSFDDFAINDVVVAVLGEGAEDGVT